MLLEAASLTALPIGWVIAITVFTVIVTKYKEIKTLLGSQSLEKEKLGLERTEGELKKLQANYDEMKEKLVEYERLSEECDKELIRREEQIKQLMSQNKFLVTAVKVTLRKEEGSDWSEILDAIVHDNSNNT